MPAHTSAPIDRSPPPRRTLARPVSSRARTATSPRPKIRSPVHFTFRYHIHFIFHTIFPPPFFTPAQWSSLANKILNKRNESPGPLLSFGSHSEKDVCRDTCAPKYERHFPQVAAKTQESPSFEGQRRALSLKTSGISTGYSESGIIYFDAARTASASRSS